MKRCWGQRCLPFRTLEPTTKIYPAEIERSPKHASECNVHEIKMNQLPPLNRYKLCENTGLTEWSDRGKDSEREREGEREKQAKRQQRKICFATKQAENLSKMPISFGSHIVCCSDAIWPNQWEYFLLLLLLPLLYSCCCCCCYCC